MTIRLWGAEYDTEGMWLVPLIFFVWAIGFMTAVFSRLPPPAVTMHGVPSPILNVWLAHEDINGMSRRVYRGLIKVQWLDGVNSRGIPLDCYVSEAPVVEKEHAR